MLVLELCDQGNLFSAIHPKLGRHASVEGLPVWKHRLSIALGVAEGMTAVHEQGIMHSDLSSMNVLV
jgi:serine/threonine protein kinase